MTSVGVEPSQRKVGGYSVERERVGLDWISAERSLDSRSERMV